jgi:hypothetical protein
MFLLIEGRMATRVTRKWRDYEGFHPGQGPKKTVEK